MTKVTETTNYATSVVNFHPSIPSSLSLECSSLVLAKKPFWLLLFKHFIKSLFSFLRLLKIKTSSCVSNSRWLTICDYRTSKRDLQCVQSHCIENVRQIPVVQWKYASGSSKEASIPLHISMPTLEALHSL